MSPLKTILNEQYFLWETGFDWSQGYTGLNLAF